jgi:hypothetical protein
VGPEIGEDLSVLVTGVDTRQAGQKYYLPADTKISS